MRSELRFDGVNKSATIRLTAESPLEQDTLLRWSNWDVSVLAVVHMAYEYPSMTLSFAEKVATIGAGRVIPQAEPKPFRPSTADGPVPPDWREDCHGDLVAPDRSSVGYEPSRHHWFVCLSGGRMTPSPKYFALRSEAVARLQELVPTASESASWLKITELVPAPWCPEVGQWVRIKKSGLPALVTELNKGPSFLALPPTASLKTTDGRFETVDSVLSLEPWRPRVGEHVVANRPEGLPPIVNQEGVVQTLVAHSDPPLFHVAGIIKRTTDYGAPRPMELGLHELSPAPTKPPAPDETAPKPWCPEVGQWVRVSPDGEVGRVKHVTIESMYEYSPTRSITVVFPGRGPMPPFPPEHLEPWRPRVGEHVVVAPSATDTFGGHEGFIKGPAPLAQGTIFWVLVDHHGCTSDIMAGLHDLSPAPPVPSKNEIDEWLRRHASVSAVGAEWRFVYPE